MKTKPTQHSVQALRAIGIIPDFILCRSEEALSQDLKKKISLFCSVASEAVFDEKDVENSIYEVPLDLFAQGLDLAILKKLGMQPALADLTPWQEMVRSMKEEGPELTIGIVGKYVEHQDAYKSVFEALHHAAIHLKVKLKIEKFQTEEGLDPNRLKNVDGFLVPGGFGERGWETKIQIAQYARENKIPYFGLCLGMQVLIVEFARNVLHLKGASSTEIHPQTEHPVISLLSEQRDVQNLGGTMRLGAYLCDVKEGSLAFQAYGKQRIFERHRHRYEFNNAYKEQFEEANLLFSGNFAEKDLVEIAEIPSHPWMLGVQFHPEFKSKPLEPHPLFSHFLLAAQALKEQTLCAYQK